MHIYQVHLNVRPLKHIINILEFCVSNAPEVVELEVKSKSRLKWENDKLAFQEEFDCVFLSDTEQIGGPNINVNDHFDDIDELSDDLLHELEYLEREEIAPTPLISLIIHDRIKILCTIEQLKQFFRFCPRSVTCITLGDHFNHDIKQGSLPNWWTHLTFGHDFNKPISKVLPHSLTHLTFGCLFNHLIREGCLPPLLSHLVLGKFYDKVICSWVFGQSLTHLSLGTEYRHDTGGWVFPESLVSIISPYTWIRWSDSGDE